MEGDLSAQEGTLVMFHCQAMGWYPSPTVSWAISYIVVDRSDFNTSDLQDPDGLFNSISVLQIKAEMSTTVECQVSAAPAHQTSSVKLTVGRSHSLMINPFCGFFNLFIKINLCL